LLASADAPEREAAKRRARAAHAPRDNGDREKRRIESGLPVEAGMPG